MTVPAVAWLPAPRAAEPDWHRPSCVSGIDPHLADANAEGECGTGAEVPWAGRPWDITYGPHLPRGSSGKLSEVDEAPRATVRPGVPSDPYLLSGSDRKTLELAHDANWVRCTADRPGRATAWLTSE